MVLAASALFAVPPASAQPPTGSGGTVDEPLSEALSVPRGAITFSDLALGTVVRDQYRYKGIRFSGDTPTVTTDRSSPGSPVLAGKPTFFGTIRGRFVVHGTNTPRTVDHFSLDVGYINDPGQVRVDVYGRAGHLIGALTPSRRGIVRVSSQFRGAASFAVRVGAAEEAGVAIDNVTYPGVTADTGNLLTNPGFESGAFGPWRPIAAAGNVNYATYPFASYAGPKKQGLRYAEFNVFGAAPSGSIGQDVSFSVHQGDVVTFRAWFRKPGCSGSYRGTLAIWTLDGPANANSGQAFSISPCGAWREIVVRHRVTAAYSTLRAEIYGQTGNGVNLDVDKASLTVNRVL